MLHGSEGVWSKAEGGHFFLVWWYYGIPWGLIPGSSWAVLRLK